MPTYQGMPTKQADAYRAGAQDAYGNAPERKLSEGGAPCRCCLKMIPEGQEMLVLAYRPFGALQPYAETGPIFLCADACEQEGTALPEIVVSPDYC